MITISVYHSHRMKENPPSSGDNGSQLIKCGGHRRSATDLIVVLNGKV